ncbi:MAG: phenylalanine--tRNA ligase subunit beta [Candidatus Micrarchaeota archaeon]|nr:phenylalanine--tRNA ligase subunit beta [Candidatus Micrarchaeota archaeon]
MVYVFARVSTLNKYIGKRLTSQQLQAALMDLGMDIKDVSGDKDPELKIEITAEKLDLVSAVGLARAIKYYLGVDDKPIRYEIVRGKLAVKVDKSVSRVRPRTAAAIIRGLNVDAESLQEIISLQEKMHESFGRRRKKAAIGIYPLERIKFPIKYRAELPDKIMFTPLGFSEVMSGVEILQKHEKGREFAHLLRGHERYPIFEDAEGKVLSMPPIINSEEVGHVHEGRQDLFIECSGHNLTHLDNVLKVVVTTLIEMGGRAESVAVEYPDETYRLDLSNYTDEIDIGFVNRLIGINLKPKEALPLLTKMMYNPVKIVGSKVQVEVPPFRSDVWHDVDIADDIARAYGYNNIAPKYPNISSVGGHLPFSQFREAVCWQMGGMGFQELYTYMLTSTDTQYRKMGLSHEDGAYVRILNSAEQGTNSVRTMILPEHLVSLNINRKNKYPQRVFEVGMVVRPKDGAHPENEWRLSTSIAGPRTNYTKIKETLDTLMGILGVEYEVKPASHGFLIAGRAGDIIVGGKPVGFIGEVHPQVLDAFGLLVPVASFEIGLKPLFSHKEKRDA